MNPSKNATFLTRVIEVAVYAVYHAWRTGPSGLGLHLAVE